MKKNIFLTILMTIIAITFLFADGIIPVGSGTEDDPYFIENLDNLLYLSTDSDLWGENIYFFQTEDIDASETETWNNGAGFDPIGGSSGFAGIYCGNGNRILNLYINRPNENNIGLFGYTNSNAIISNLRLENVNIVGSVNVGGLIGEKGPSSVFNCFSSGMVEGYNTVGGLIGKNLYNSVNCSYSEATVIGHSNIGGLVGKNEAFISNCYSYGIVNGYTNTGGLIGYQNPYAHTYDSFWDIDTSRQPISGGGEGKTTEEMKTLSTYTDAGWDFAGESENGDEDIWLYLENLYPFLNFAQLEQIFFTIPLSANFGIVPQNETADIQISIINMGVEPITIEQDNIYILNGEYFTLSDYNNYPLQLEEDESAELTITFSASEPITYSDTLVIIDNSSRITHTIPLSAQRIYFSGNGNEQSPYEINSLADLEFLSNNKFYWQSDFVQTSDIDASDTENWNDGLGFAPIGDNFYNFTGNYDGNGHIVSNLFINRPYSESTGLFGTLNSSEINNLGLENATIIGEDETGGLVGTGTDAIIENCYSTGNISGENSVGGLVGSISSGTISNNYSSANVSGEQDVGGLIGGGYGTISNNYSTGNISGEQSVGGLVGDIFGTITNSYSSGNVSGERYVGGLVGFGANTIIESCYSIGNVSGEREVGGLVGVGMFITIESCYSIGNVSGENYVGGLLGANIVDSNVINSFWDIETSGQTSSEGGTGKTTVEMQTLSTYTDAGWDFEGETENGTDDEWLFVPYNYPYLSWQTEFPPYILAMIEDITIAEDFDEIFTLNLSQFFADYDDDLFYDFSTTNDDIAGVAIDGNYLSIYCLPENSGIFEITITASETDRRNRSRNSISQTFEVTVYPVNDAPVIDEFSPENTFEITEEQEIEFSVTASDIDSETLNYSWYFDDDEIGETTSSYSHIFDTNGEYEVRCIVDDGDLQAENVWIITVIITSSETDAALPISTKLVANYPNPFNPTTNISFSIKKGDKANLQIYNIRGQLVKSLGIFEQGYHSIIWGGKNNKNQPVSSGIYYCSMTTNEDTSFIKMILLK